MTSDGVGASVGRRGCPRESGAQNTFEIDRDAYIFAAARIRCAQRITRAFVPVGTSRQSSARGAPGDAEPATRHQGGANTVRVFGAAWGEGVARLPCTLRIGVFGTDVIDANEAVFTLFVRMATPFDVGVNA